MHSSTITTARTGAYQQHFTAANLQQTNKHSRNTFILATLHYHSLAANKTTSATHHSKTKHLAKGSASQQQTQLTVTPQDAATAQQYISAAGVQHQHASRWQAVTHQGV